MIDWAVTDVRVIDLAQYDAGSIATVGLALMGADVIKKSDLLKRS